MVSSPTSKRQRSSEGLTTGVPELGVLYPRILLPDSSKVDMKKWAVVACDQYTSEEDYWKRVEETVGDAPSTLRITFPEVYLEKGHDEEIISDIIKRMHEYEEKEFFCETKTNGVVLVERTFRSGVMRKGVILALDLEKYSFKAGSQTVIRATEKTIESRIPPRLKIRRAVDVELPHIIVLIDDPEDSVLSSLAQHCAPEHEIYETELMENSGHIKGFWIDNHEALKELSENFENLAHQENFKAKYSLSEQNLHPLVFAMGDGNHSLATAKTWWEEIKEVAKNNSTFDSLMACHPARYALVEIQNCQDPSLEFEPINRLLLGIVGGAEQILSDLKAHFEASGEGPVVIGEGDDVYNDVASSQPGNDPHAQSVGYVVNGKRGCCTIVNPKKNIAVASMTDFIDGWLAKHTDVKIDYVHETTAIDRLCTAHHPDNIGFVFSAMAKSDLFKSVILDGVLPRKTFSMGASHDKRFYFEGRRIKGDI